MILFIKFLKISVIFFKENYIPFIKLILDKADKFAILAIASIAKV